MHISIFSKFEMCGGSEFRSVELANGLKKFTEHDIYLLAEKGMSPPLSKHIYPGINVIEHSLSKPDCFYNSDKIIVVNTDTPDFSTLDYWTGKSARHSLSLDMSKMRGKRMFFVYNFLISPARHLHELADTGVDICILPTNNKFFNEITTQDRYDKVRLFPRYILESPIDPTKLDISVRKPNKDSICFGMHSKGNQDKWNDEIYQLIVDLNKRYSDNIKFRFMGIKGSLKTKLKSIPNVTCLVENEESVKDFLSQLDVFVFFPNWKREEPWARVIAEAMVSGCPIIALNRGGTPDQILNYNNGFLCKDYKDYFRHIVYLMEHKNTIESMSNNSIRISKRFYTENVIKKLMSF